MSKEFFERFPGITVEEGLELNRITKETCELEMTSEVGNDDIYLEFKK